MKKRIIFRVICLVFSLCFGSAYAEEIADLPIYLNEKIIEFNNPPIIREGCTIIPMREFSEKAGFKVIWDEFAKSINAYNEESSVMMYIDDPDIRAERNDGTVSEYVSVLPPQLINSVTYIPLRTVSEALGAKVLWDGDNRKIYIYMENAMENLQEESVKKNTFYSQYDPEYIELYGEAPYNWTAGRNGYCYVTSYAMLLSDVTGEVITPKDVADINYAACGNPSMCYHGSIVGKYNKKLVPALAEDSLYYKSYDSTRGLTYIDNSNSENVIGAIKEALDRNPHGVLVRDTSMPHTMVAVGYEGDTIFFNDPALSEGNAKWEETCLKKRDITTIEAIGAIR